MIQSSVFWTVRSTMITWNLKSKIQSHMRYSVKAKFSLLMKNVAHNGDFDKGFINATAQREGIYRFNWPMMIDTMKTTTELCRLPGRGRGGYKWPKLIELAECLRIKTDDINLHDSSADVELTKRCFLYLLEKKFYNL